MKQLLTLPGLVILFGFITYPALANPSSSLSVTTPILSVTPTVGEFGSGQVGEEWPIYFTLKNTGISVLKIKKIEVVGSNFSLNDDHTYPFEIIADSSSAFPVGNSGKKLEFSVLFAPDDVGVFTGTVLVTYGLYSDETYEIPLTGEGISCYLAEEAHIGRNWGPKHGMWFKYTADKFSIVEFNSCDSTQTTIAYDWSLIFFLYGNCEGLLYAEPDFFMESRCPYNPTAVSQTWVMNAGESIYLYWPELGSTSPYAGKEFYFNINVTFPMDGDVCETAIPLTLPVVNMFGSTWDFQDDYDASPCSPIYNYMGGNDIVYTITIPQDGYLNGSILGAYASIHVLDICPKEEFSKEHCIAYTGGNDGGHFTKRIRAGTYYVIVSSWSPPQSMDFLLNLNWQSSSGVEDQDLSDRLQVFPNPTHEKFTVAVNNNAVADLTIELISMSGQRIYRKDAHEVLVFLDEIDVSGLATGVYYLKVNNGTELQIEKVIIQ